MSALDIRGIRFDAMHKPQCRSVPTISPYVLTFTALILGSTGLYVSVRQSRVVNPAVAETRSAPKGDALISAIGLAARSRSIDMIGGMLRRDLVLRAPSSKDWAPDTMLTPDICRTTRRTMFSSAVAFATKPLVRRAAEGRQSRSKRSASRQSHSSARVAVLDGISRVRLDGGFQSSEAFEPASAVVAPASTMAALDIAPVLQQSPEVASVTGLGNPVADHENRRGTAIGLAADTLQFDDRPGRFSTAAEAGLWNGAPATAMGIGYTLPGGRLRLDATGVTNVNAWSAIGKTFEISTVASIPLN